MKNILFVMSQPPYCGTTLQETLDIVLTAAVFDQHISLLFMDEGVYQIKSGQNPLPQAKKDTSAIFKALEIYQVENYYLETESATEHGLSMDDFFLPVKPVCRKDIHDFMQGFDVVFSD